MTVSYNLDVSSSKAWTFMKLVLRWRGSIWKSVSKELLLWIVGYYCMFGLLRWFDEEDKENLWALAQRVDEQLDWIPLQFMLGFFVTIVVDRWKQIFSNIGFIDNLALRLATYMDGDKPEDVIARRNIIRYVCLSQVLVLRDIAVPVRKRFRNMEMIVNAGFMNEDELKEFDRVDNGFPKYWMPISWAYHLVRQQRRKENFVCDLFCHSTIEELRTFRENLQKITNYDWVPVPLAYTQVVFMAVRVYFLLCIFSRQYTTEPDMTNHWYNIVHHAFPLITVLQFFFCMGWLKVAEALLNPLGDDDDDFETNFIIDRNLAVGLTIVDECRSVVPEQRRDLFKDNEFPLDIANTSDDLNRLVGSATQYDEEDDAPRKNSIQQGFKNIFQKRLSRSFSTVRPIDVEELARGMSKAEFDMLQKRRSTIAPTLMETVTEEDRNYSDESEQSTIRESEKRKPT